MEIGKQVVIDLLRQRGDAQQADQAERELPDQFDPGQHGELLGRFGLDPQEVADSVKGGEDTGF